MTTLSIGVVEGNEHRTVAVGHFGLNFVADWERIGQLPWQRFDDVIATLNTNTLRYPGGVTAELHFDIRDPNSDQIVLANGQTREIMGAYDFASFASQNGIDSVFIIPTMQLLQNTAGSDGIRRIDQSNLPFIYDFVFSALQSTNGAVSVFEIGNEYESYMTAREYGALVNRIAPEVERAIQDFVSQTQIPTNPQIAMQVWSWLANDSSTLTAADLTARATNSFNQLSAEARDLIDTVVTHWYARDRGAPYIDAYNSIETSVQTSLSIVDHFQSLFGRDLSVYVSEWNTNHNVTQFWGLAQVPVMVRTFGELVQAGADDMSLWATMHQPTSLALNSGQLTAAGVVFQYMQESLVGTSVFDIATSSENIAGVAFQSISDTTIILSNRLGIEVTYTFDASNLLEDHFVSRIGLLTVDASVADGLYRGRSGLALFNEPDLPGILQWSAVDANSTQEISFSPFQTAVIELLRIADLRGTAGNDYFIATSNPERFFGGDGFDTISYAQSDAGVDVNLSTGAARGGFAQGDSIRFFESIIGSRHDDLIAGNSVGNLLIGGAGNDVLRGFGGDDTLESGPGIDQLVGGFGNDLLILNGDGGTAFGEEGDDVFEIHSGSYRVWGGLGNDKIDFSLHNGAIEVSDGRARSRERNGLTDVEFFGVEEFTGSAYDDFFRFTNQEVLARGGDGADRFSLFEDTSGVIEAGRGNDTIFSASRDMLILAEEGDDLIITAVGSSNFINPGVGDDTIVSLGHDRIYFDTNDGDDVVIGFVHGSDILDFSASAINAFRGGNYELNETDQGVRLNFYEGGSVIFHRTPLTQLQSEIELWM